MYDCELNSIVAAWIAGQEAVEGTPEYKNNWWAISQVMDWWLQDEAELLWRFILLTYGREMSDQAFAVLAAGPLEDLLARYGPRYIDRVEQLAGSDEKFNLLLGGVWQNEMTDEVWQRVQAARREVW